MKSSTQCRAVVLLILILNLICIHLHAQNMVYLDANNVKAGFYPSAVFFSEIYNDTFLNKASFEVPKGSGINAMFAYSFWLTGYDQFGNLHGTISQYDPIHDWAAGPISSSYDTQYDSLYKRVFKISSYEIAYHIANYSSNGYVLPESIKRWPGNGRVSFNESAQLAPFIDKNGNGFYEPELGDYPDICGDQAVFFILNDIKSPSLQSGCSKMNAEMTVLAYEKNGDDSVLNNTVFLRLRITNHSSMDYSNVLFSNFMDADLGCYSNDRIGCNPASNSFFVYNNSGNDGSSCGSGLGYASKHIAQGVTFLNKKLELFDYIYDGGPPEPAVNCNYFRHYQTGIFGNGAHLTVGGCGFGGSTTTNFAYIGDPTISTEWSEVNPQIGPSIPAGDRREIGTIALDTFKAGTTKEIDIAIVTTLRDSVNIPFAEVPLLLNDIQYVRGQYQNQLAQCSNEYTSIEEKRSPQSIFNIYPNPSHSSVIIELERGVFSASITLLDIQGQIVKKMPIVSNETQLDVSAFAKGIYLLKVQSGENTSIKRIVVE